MVSTFVLVHGAWHGSWAWEKVVPLLERAGHRVEAPDLPGHGDDRTPPPEVSLQGYVDEICSVIDAQPEPVVLVGHSMGGIVISEAAERRPDGIGTLVYLTAFLLPSGKALVDYALEDGESVVTQNLQVHEDRMTATVPTGKAREAFYGECSDEDAERAESLLQPQPWLPFATPVTVTEPAFGRVPRVYIECLRDRAITAAAQKRMYTDLPCREVLTMDTDHSPFLSAPERLAEYLISTADALSQGGGSDGRGTR